MKVRTLVEGGLAVAGIAGGLLGVKMHLDQQAQIEALQAQERATRISLCQTDNTLLVHDYIIARMLDLPVREPIITDCDTNTPLQVPLEKPMDRQVAPQGQAD